jgi:regulator of protease activity HflC (stomatin/prohibitin superfamily)
MVAGTVLIAVVGIAVVVLIALLVLAASGVRIVREYERIVVFRFGRLVGPRGPGLVWIVPLVDRTRKVSLQIDTADIPPQDVITKDNVTVHIEAAVFYRVLDPAKSVVQIRDYEEAILRIAQTTLRATLSQHDLDDLLANQAVVNEQLKLRIDEATEPWGVQVVGVETKDVDLPETMQRAMARQAEAERERRAKVIAAEGEYQAAERLAEAAALLGREQHAITLRTLQTLAEVATEQNSTLIFPVPADLISVLRSSTPAGPPPDKPLP